MRTLSAAAAVAGCISGLIFSRQNFMLIDSMSLARSARRCSGPSLRGPLRVQRCQEHDESGGGSVPACPVIDTLTTPSGAAEGSAAAMTFCRHVGRRPVMVSAEGPAVTPESTYIGQWWKEYLTAGDGHAWFEQWNILMQSKFEELSVIAESDSAEATAAERDREPTNSPYRVLMVGDSTMKHQFGVACAFLAERPGRRFEPTVRQDGSPGCCVDTTNEDGGGRGLCFEYNNYRFLNPVHAAESKVDAYYFGCGLHLLHITPVRPLEALRTQEWLAYEHLLADTVTAVRQANGPNVTIAFMTVHVIADEVFEGEFASVRDAYRKREGNATLRASCDAQVDEAVTGGHLSYPEHRINLDDYPKGEGDFGPETYCNEGLLDRHGSLQLNRRARHAMWKARVPLVDAGRIVDGQAWATGPQDGRHFKPLVPVELYTLLGILSSSSAASASEATVHVALVDPIAEGSQGIGDEAGSAQEQDIYFEIAHDDKDTPGHHAL